MAKIADLVDDLTGQLGVPGGGSTGGRASADPYMQSMQARASAGPVSPIPLVPPVQLTKAPPPPTMSPPMDASASLQAAQQAQYQRAALEGDVMRPPYSQPYSPMAYAVQPGFQRAPLNGGLQVPGWNAADGCNALQGTPARPSPAAQMQAVQQQRMAQLQAQQQAQMAQMAAAQAGQACLQKHKQKGKTAGGMAGSLAAAEPAAQKEKGWMIFGIVLAIVLLAIFVLGIVAVVRMVQNSHRIDSIASVLQAPVS